MNEISAPKVSIICAWYNRADYIKDTVDGLLSQDFDDYEIIIANDGSTDPNVKVILDGYDDPRLTVIHKENEGFTKTIKMLAEKAKAPYVAIQGAGDVSYANRIAVQYQFLNDNERYCFVGCLSTNVVKKVGEPDVHLKEVQPICGEIEMDPERKRHPFVHGSVMFKKEEYLKIGGYRSIFKYAQDYDLFLRISRIGKCYNLDKVLYQTNVFPDGVATTPERSLEQAMFVTLANRCYKHNLSFNIDPIEEFGGLALLLYSFGLKDKVAFYKTIIKFIFLKEYKKAEIFIGLSVGWPLACLLRFSISLVERNELLGNFVRLAIKKLSHGTVFLKAND